MNIRKAQIKDLKEIDEIYCEGQIDEEKNKPSGESKKEIIKDLANSEKERLSGFRKAIHSSKERFLVCEVAGKLIGFADAVLSSKKRSAEVALIYLRKEHRKKGFGTKLLQELMSWLKEKGENKVVVTMDVTNLASINLNKKVGFKETAIIMQKKLNNR
ncbi:GNAT family N-acetyltransferase [Candidatus Woesearchaeota archaeon]|nr:GNAT family N-acetyltransferase [Candidatus Woesearchaeota archaeon]